MRCRHVSRRGLPVSKTTGNNPGVAAVLVPDPTLPEVPPMHILLLDTGSALRQLSTGLADAGHTIQQVADLAEARAALTRNEIDAVVGDPRLLDCESASAQDGSAGSTAPNSLRAQMRRFEAQVIVRALEEADGD